MHLKTSFWEGPQRPHQTALPEVRNPWLRNPWFSADHLMANSPFLFICVFLNFTSCLKSSFAGYTILSGQFLLSRAWSYYSTFRFPLLPSRSWLSLNCCSLRGVAHSFKTFKIVSLPLVFWSFCMICLRVHFFFFILFEMDCAPESVNLYFSLVLEIFSQHFFK